MTLHSRVRIVEPTAIGPVWNEGLRLLGAAPGSVPCYERLRGTPYFTDDPAGGRLNNARHNEPAQGLPALYWVEWGADGTLDDGTTWDGTYQDKHWGYECEGDQHNCPPVASIEIHFDTAYGWTAYNGSTCSDLHAWIIRELGAWISARGLTWYWQNEYSGVWYPASVPTTKLCLHDDRPANPDRGAPPWDGPGCPVGIQTGFQFEEVLR